MKVTEKTVNILVVHNFYRIPGGEDTVVANETALLRQNGHEVVTYTRSNNEFADLKGFSKLKKLLLPFVTIYNPRTAREVKRIIKEQKIDVVHVHNTLNLISPAVYYASVKCGVPVVQTIHNFRLLCPAATFYREEGGQEVKGRTEKEIARTGCCEKEITKPDCAGKDDAKQECTGHVCEDCVNKGLSCALKHKCYRGSYLETLACVMLLSIHRFLGIYKKINYICLTEFNRQKLLESAALLGIDDSQVFVKPNFMTKCNDASANTSPDCGKYFLYAGRLDKLKGVDFLVKSWKEDLPKLVVCGTGPLESDMGTEIMSCGQDTGTEIMSCVELRGYVSHEEVMNLVENATGVILPTRWYEGFPMTIVESYSVGTPVIATNIGNAGSLVIDGVTGYKFEVDDPMSLYEALKRVLDDGAKLRKSTLNEFEEKYTATKNHEELMRIYEKLM